MSLSIAVRPGAPIGEEETVHAAVLAQAARFPQAPALCGPGEDRVTYAELVRRAYEIRDLLTGAGVRPGAFVPVRAVPGAAFAIAALGVLLAGAAYAAVDPDWPAERVDGVLADLDATVVLDAVDTDGARVRAVRAAAPGHATAGMPGAGDAACVFFTSGSTGRPKGVVVPHRAFVRTFVDGGFAAFGRGTVMPLLAAPYWDAGALEVFGPLMNGGCCVVPAERLLTPDGLRALIGGQQVNTAWLTSSLVNLLVDEDIDAFEGIQHLMTGGERLSEPHVAALRARFPGLRLTNGYGPVESMVFVSTYDIGRQLDDGPYGIPLGSPVRGTLLAVLDAAGRPVEHGTAGELWVAGDGLALGYLARPEEDERRFATLTLPGHGALRAYRTGDRVVLDGSGRLSFLGRLDRQFKIRGHRVEPGEVERRIAELPGVRQAFLVPVRDERSTVVGTVCVYVTGSGRALPDARLRGHAAATLAGYLRPDRFLHLEPVPLGPTGKADLRAVEAWALARPGAGAAGGEPGTSDAGEAGEAGKDSPAKSGEGDGGLGGNGAEAGGPSGSGAGDGSESAVLRAVREILALPALGADADLLDAGANSLQVLRVAARLSRQCGLSLSARDVYRHPSVAALEDLVRQRPATPAREAADVPGTDTHIGAGAGADTGQLSPGERRFWLAERLAPGAPGHVVVTRTEVTGPLDPDRLRQALTAVAAAHPALRTSFPRQGARPRRSVAGRAAPVPLTVRRSAGDPERAEWGQWEEQQLVEELAAGLHDLDRGPLFAGALLTLGPRRHLLLIGVHHLVYDGASDAVVMADLAAAYAGSPPAAAPGPPEDAGLAPAERERQRAFWRGQVEDAPALALPYGAAPSMRELWTRDVVAHPVRLSGEQASRVKELAAAERCPALVVLLAAWWRTLAKVTGQYDLTIGTVVDTRGPQEERTVGYLANGLPVRITADPAQPPGELLALARERLFDVLAHPALPTDEIAALAPRPPDGRAPLYQNILALQRTGPPQLTPDGVRFTPLAAPPLGPQTELCCELWDDGLSYTGAVLAPEGLLDAQALAEIADRFRSELLDLSAPPGPHLAAPAPHPARTSPLRSPSDTDPRSDKDPR
ncbi:AMP-binding protein [Streptomyces sp. NBC_01304]|uniref:AMP-binding protein n=1 Tax=Streptomyces sp. NBC_01304 TaxID=2903818 RepID=UPI002E146D20|nr:AMP-binding protein [Streptomyces sp. NBC_01304]